MYEFKPWVKVFMIIWAIGLICGMLSLCTGAVALCMTDVSWALNAILLGVAIMVCMICAILILTLASAVYREIYEWVNG